MVSSTGSATVMYYRTEAGDVGVQFDRGAVQRAGKRGLEALELLPLQAELVLAQPPHPLVGIDRHRPRARLQLPAQDLHERGLAAPVGTDQPVAVAAADVEVIKKGKPDEEGAEGAAPAAGEAKTAEPKKEAKK